MIWGFISKTENIFLNILGSTYWLKSLQSIRKDDIRNFCLFVYFPSYNHKSKFSFLQTVQLRRDMSYLLTSHFCVKSYYRFLALIFFHTLKKIPLENYVCKFKIIKIKVIKIFHFLMERPYYTLKRSRVFQITLKIGENRNFAWKNFDHLILLSCWRQHPVNIV